MAAFMDEDGVKDGAGSGERLIECERAEARGKKREFDEFRAFYELDADQGRGREPTSEAAGRRRKGARRERHARHRGRARRWRHLARDYVSCLLAHAVLSVDSCTHARAERLSIPCRSTSALVRR